MGRRVAFRDRGRRAADGDRGHLVDEGLCPHRAASVVAVGLKRRRGTRESSRWSGTGRIGGRCSARSPTTRSCWARATSRLSRTISPSSRALIPTSRARRSPCGAAAASSPRQLRQRRCCSRSQPARSGSREPRRLRIREPHDGVAEVAVEHPTNAVSCSDGATGGATGRRGRSTPRAAAAPSGPTEAPPSPLPADALARRRLPAWPRS